MHEQQDFVRGGFGRVRPYVYGPLALWDLVRDAFGAVELERHDFSPTAHHVAARLGDSVIVLELRDPPYDHARPGSIYLYTPDADADYRRALSLGASSFAEPTDKPYQERMAGVRDSFGNTWWLSTYRG